MTTSGDFGPNGGTCPQIQLYIQKASDNIKIPRLELEVGDHKFLALFESGATRSLISYDLYDELLRKSATRIQHYTKHVAVNLFDVNSRRLNTRGTVTLQFRVSSETEHETLFQSFIIADGISEKCILGLDALYSHKFMFNGREQTIY